jgi:NAD(P)H-hydrate epimerase
VDIQIPEDLPRLPPRAAESHKGDYGRALLIGGSRGMAGAIALAGMAALRSGAGLVKLAVPDVCLENVAHFEPSYMTAPLECDEQGRIATAALERLHELAEQSTCLALGPGLGRGHGLTRLVGWLYRILPQPMVIDADALYAIAQARTGAQGPVGPRILTPHPGEFARLQQTYQVDSPEALAAACNAIVVLKGHRTLITDGNSSFHNATGNPGMASGGSGDVLTGIITALLGQHLLPLDAARLGVFAHGLAGDLAAQDLGQVAMNARDLIDFLPDAWQLLAAR